MARTKEYRHYCPVARSLEVVGEKWSLLIVRDLLFGPLRFSDLLDSLGGVTPKLLTTRLRELEGAGIVERDQVSGRREVWYCLTPKGRDLRPVVEALVGWGIEYARPREPGEAVHPMRAAAIGATLLNRARVRPASATLWTLQFGSGHHYALRFDGEGWSFQPRPDPNDGDIRIETSPEMWLAFVSASEERERLLDELQITGPAERIEEFQEAFRAAGR